MHSAFCDWLRVISLEPNIPSAKKLWQSVERFGRQVTSEDIIPLVRLAMGLPSSSCMVSLPNFAKVFKFNMKPAGSKVVTLEQRILAAAVLVYRFDSHPGSLSDITALAMVCVRGCGCMFPKMTPDFTGFAELYLKNRGVAVRKLSKIAPLPNAIQQLDLIIRDLNNSLAKLPQENNVEEAIQKINIKLKQMKTTLQTADSHHIYDNNEYILLEQGRILLWLVSSVHNTRDTLSRSESAVRVARELAEQLLIVPPPVYLRAVIASSPWISL